MQKCFHFSLVAVFILISMFSYKSVNNVVVLYYKEQQYFLRIYFILLWLLTIALLRGSYATKDKTYMVAPVSFL